MKVKLIPGPRNEELIEKVAKTQGNAEAIESLWDNEGYSPSAVLDSLFYAANDERLKLKIREVNNGCMMNCMTGFLSLLTTG